ncbi:MAG TPA: hypothetical protein VK787_05675 [Puia sp.]|jgi:hypothetical protein|nr:hypothetical protein [Puia sp.]
MEVHHHPDVHLKRKRFKEYFLEFLMIFLAVTMGFFAENIREYFSNQEKERKYVQTLYYDLKDDTAHLNGNIPFWENQIKTIDTLRGEIKKGDRMNTKVANIMATKVRFYSNFQYHDRTITQLKSTGNFRLLNAALADSIMEYDSYITSQLRDQEAHGQKLYIEVNNLQNKIFESGLRQLYQKNGVAYLDSLFTADPSAFKIHRENTELVFEYYNSLDFWQLGIYWRLRSSLHLKEKAINMIQLIQKQYHLENE